MTKINNTFSANEVGPPAEKMETSAQNDKSSAPKKALGLYLHIPFCIRKCNYCDFLSFADVPEEDQKAYFRSLLREIGLNGEIYGKNYYVDTIFIGGGTPSLVEENLLYGLLQAVRSNFNIAGDAEITVESNPKTITKGKLNAWLAAGVNRLSIGAQSLDDGLLSYMGRVHTADDFLKNYSLARECGFRNINIDLMFAIPGQSMEVWMDTLERAAGLEPEHISFYSLQLEEGTPFFTLLQEGRLKETGAELDRAMYHAAVEALKERGYVHYEISNASKDGYQCRHNLKYWSMDDYLGLGLGAHSFMDEARFSNETGLERYIKTGIQNDAGSDGKAHSPFVVGSHKNTEADSISEFLFTGMRKTEGVDLKDFVTRFKLPVKEIFSANWHRIRKFSDEGYLICSEDSMLLTEKGIDISNIILAEFIL